MSVFTLSKWYADCIDSSGNVAILYHATLRIGGVPIRYESLLTKSCDEQARSHYSVRPGREPVFNDGVLTWMSKRLVANGTWRKRCDTHRELLYTSGADTLNWNCLAPRATAEICISDDHCIQGYGYAEHVLLSIPPWRLPIQTLRWGRFINETDSMTWIDWTGRSSKRLVLLNGALTQAKTINDDAICFDEHSSLAFRDRQVLREGKLGSTALAVIPGVKQKFPESLLNLSETKWLSRATLRRRGLPDSIGMAIHEVVQWP